MHLDKKLHGHPHAAQFTIEVLETLRNLSQALICQFISISKSKFLENHQDPTGIPVPVPVPVEFEPVPVDLAGTRPVPRFLFSERIFKVAKRTVENKYSLKSGIV